MKRVDTKLIGFQPSQQLHRTDVHPPECILQGWRAMLDPIDDDVELI